MRIHPAVALTYVVSVSVVALLSSDSIELLAVFVSTLPVVAVWSVIRPWRAAMGLAIASGLLFLVLNPLLSPSGANVVARADFYLPLLGRPTITQEAIAFAVVMALRLAVVLSVSSLLSAIDLDALLSAVAARARPSVVLPLGLAMRFLPVVAVDAASIADVQRARGLALDARGPLGRAVAHAHLAMPLLETSLDRAASIAEAMEARGFGSKQRTQYRPPTFGRADWLGLAIALAPAVVVVASAVSTGHSLLQISVACAAFPLYAWRLQ